MKNLSYILIPFLIFSCTQVRYLNKPIDGNPCIGLDKRILIAKDGNLDNRSFGSDICLDGLLSSLEQKSINIADCIDFHQKIDYQILNELKSSYNADGLLLLKDLSDNTFEDINEARGPTCVGCATFSVDLYNDVISIWEYFDFTTGNTFIFSVIIEREEKTSYQQKSIESYFNYKHKTKTKLLFENGRICSEKLVGS